MASTNFLVTSLPDYVQTNHDILVKNFALLGGGTRSRISIQTGIKKDAYINFLELTPTLQDGSECGFSSAGNVELTQRVINTAAIKVDLDICPRNLLGKYAEYLVRVNATEETLPFEQYILDAAVAEINKKIETLMWQGDTSSSDTNLKWIDGFVAIAGADSNVVDVAISSTSAYAGILSVYMAMTEETLSRGGVIFVSPAIYRVFLQEMVQNNYFHYAGAVNEYPEAFILPGTDVQVIRTEGLAGNLNIVGSFAKNLYYGCDMEHDAEDIDLWYSKDDRLFKLEALWNSGVQFAFPAEVVLGTFANAPALS